MVGNFPRVVTIVVHDDDDVEVEEKTKVRYVDPLPKCSFCCCFGHWDEDCAIKQKSEKEKLLKSTSNNNENMQEENSSKSIQGIVTRIKKASSINEIGASIHESITIFKEIRNIKEKSCASDLLGIC